MPVITLPNREDWPQELRDQLSESEAGGFSLNIVPKAKLDEFRETNIEVSKKLETATAELEVFRSAVGDDFDPETFPQTLADLRQTAQRVEDGELSASADIEKTLAERTQKMREDLENANKAALSAKAKAEQERDAYKGQYHGAVLERHVYDAVIDEETGANPQALSYILSDASKIFQFGPDGELIPKKGEATIYGPDGASPMTVKEWVAEHVSSHPLLAKQSGGGGEEADPSKKYLGMSEEAYNKLSPMQKLEAANKGSAKGIRR